MNKYVRSGLVALFSGATLVAWAADPAATLRHSQGKVFVGQGSAMMLAREEMPLYPGSRVVVAGGQAEIVFADGCIVAMPENSLLTVKGSNQCRLGQAQVRATGGFQNKRIGQGGSLSSADGAVANLLRPINDVSVVREGSERQGRPNMSLLKTDEIVTGDDSKATVNFLGCVLTLGSGDQGSVGELRDNRCTNGVAQTSGGESGKQIAIIKKVQGNVLVNGAPGRNNMGLNASSQLAIGPGASAVVEYEGCEVDVPENEKDKVENLVTKCIGGYWAFAGGGAAALAGGAAVVGGIGVAGLIPVGAALGATLVGAVVVDNGNEDQPASPSR
ncbi:MAG: hypothetical protein WAT67_06500 [Candidatus Contendobacter sp.]